MYPYSTISSNNTHNASDPHVTHYARLYRTKQEDAAALAARNKTNTPSVDHGVTSGGGGVTPSVARQYERLNYESVSATDVAHGSHSGAMPRAMGVDAALASKDLGAMGKVANGPHRLPCEASRKIPARRSLEHTRGEVECLGGGGGVGCGGLLEGDVGTESGRRSACRGGAGNGHGSFPRGREEGGRPVPPTGSTAQAKVGDEEKRLMASIARLDTLLQKERSSTGPSSTGAGEGCSGAEKNERLGGSSQVGTERDRKPPRKGGIAKSRVRKGGGNGTKTCGSAYLDGATPAETSVVASTAVASSSAVATAAGASAAPTTPVLFPPVYRGLPLPENRLDGGRYRQLDTEDKLEQRDIYEDMPRGFPGGGQGSRDHGRGGPSRGPDARLPVSVMPETSRQPVFMDHQHASRREDRAPPHEFYQLPRDCHRPTFTPPRRTVDGYPDRNGGGRRSPRYPVYQEEGRMEQGSHTPVSYREVPPDVGRQDLLRGFGGNRYEMPHSRDDRRGYYCEDGRLPADDPHDAWNRDMGQQEWERRPPQHRGGYLEERSDVRVEGGGRTAWVRCGTFGSFT